MGIVALYTLVAAAYVASAVSALQFKEGAPLWTFVLATLVLLAIACAVFGDYFYNEKVAKRKARHRLPWHLRWDGWAIGHPADPDGPNIGRMIAHDYYYHSGAEKLLPIHQWQHGMPSIDAVREYNRRQRT